MSNDPPRILAIDPGTRYMGIAILDGSELIYYGVNDFRRKRPADTLLGATRETLCGLIAEYRPSVLAYEKSFYVQSKNSVFLQAQEAEIKRVARMRGLKAVGYAPTTVRQLLCEDRWATKEEVADLLAARYPELLRYRNRSDWVSEKYWLHMFDAVAVAVVCAEAGLVSGADGVRARPAVGGREVPVPWRPRGR